MTMQSQLWMSYANNQVTCQASLHDIRGGLLIKATINGQVDGVSELISRLMTTMIECHTCTHAIFDFSSTIFQDGVVVSDDAINCALSIISVAAAQNINTSLVIGHNVLREILERTLHSTTKYKNISIISEKDMMIINSGLYRV